MKKFVTENARGAGVTSKLPKEILFFFFFERHFQDDKHTRIVALVRYRMSK